MPHNILPLFLLLFLLAGGCGEPSNDGTVSGTITVDGELVETGAIAFIPVDGKSRTSGAVIEKGKYTAQVPVGKMKVEINAPKFIGQQYQAYDAPGSRVTQMAVEMLPPKYNSETILEVDVQRGENPPTNFDLSTKE